MASRCCVVFRGISSPLSVALISSTADGSCESLSNPIWLYVKDELTKKEIEFVKVLLSGWLSYVKICFNLLLVRQHPVSDWIFSNLINILINSMVLLKGLYQGRD